MHDKKYISLRNLTFSFTALGKPFFYAMNIDFAVGRINFICGKNGMGKSTLLKILSNDIDQQNLQGILQIDDQQYDLKSLHVLADSIAMVAQNFNTMLVDTYSFTENLQFALLPNYPFFTALPLPSPLPDFLKKYGINPDVPISLLSGGQRQILSILMILQRSPKILLLDEPIAALDEENSIIVLDFLQDLCVQEDITIIAIIHHLDLVEKYAGKQYFELYQESGIRKIRTVIIST